MFQCFKARLTAAAGSMSPDGLIDRSRQSLRRVSRRALWLLDLDDVLVSRPSPEPFSLPPFDDDMRRVKIHRAGPQRGKVEDLPAPPIPPNTHAPEAPVPVPLAVPVPLPETSQPPSTDAPREQPNLAHPQPHPSPASAAITRDPCSDRSSAQVNNHPRVTLAHDRVIIDLPTTAPKPSPQAAVPTSALTVGATSGDPVDGLPPVSMGSPGIALPAPPPGAKPRKAKKMSKDKQELSFEGEMPVDKIITYLRGLADGLAEGTVPVESGLDRVILEAAPSMTMKIKAKVKKRDNALKIELAWTTPEGVGLKIGGEADK